MQGTMYVTVSDDLAYAKVKLEDVSVKIYEYRGTPIDCLVSQLIERFKSSKPSKITFLSANTVTRLFVEKLKDLNYTIDTQGNIYQVNKEILDFQESKEDKLSVVELLIEDEYRFEELCKILVYEGYVISGEVKNDKFKVLIH